MFESFLGSPDDAIAILKSDHEKVKHLFDQFEDADNLREKKKIVADAIMELKIHAEIEEKIFYPAVRREVEKDLMFEADEEHHVAKLLIAELEQMDGSEDHWEAKFTVLSENIRHHIREEEGQMLPQARAIRMNFQALGRQLLAMKQQLKRNGVPLCDEEKLMQRTGARADSPAKAAKPKSSPKAKTASGNANKGRGGKATAKGASAGRNSPGKKPVSQTRAAAGGKRRRG